MKPSLFKEIDEFNMRDDSDAHSSVESSCSDFLNTTLEAYESQIFFTKYSTDRNNSQQLKYIQEVFENVQSTTDESESHSFDFNISPLTINDDKRTTLMIRNIPPNYNKEMLIKEIEIQFKHKYDFLNFPYDLKTATNNGYAFVNLKLKNYLKEFYTYFNGRKWIHAPNHVKPCYLKYARVQQKRKQLRLCKPISPQIYMQQSSLIQLVQSQKQQLNM